MKVAVRLAILFAALLLVSNMAFAKIVCDQQICYNITATDENGNTYSDYWVACINNKGTGSLISDNAGFFDLYLFGGGPGWFNTSGDPGFVNGDPKWTTWIAHGTSESGFLQPIGDGWMLTGEGVRIENTRYTVQGMRIPCISCAPGFNRCGDQCVNLNTDSNNCGECGNVCSPLYECRIGHCIED